MLVARSLASGADSPYLCLVNIVNSENPIRAIRAIQVQHGKSDPEFSWLKNADVRPYFGTSCCRTLMIKSLRSEQKVRRHFHIRFY